MSTFLTKEQLKAELVNHGIQLPSSAARKEEYQKLYRQHVQTSSTGQFSSDDDDNEEDIETNNDEISSTFSSFDISVTVTKENESYDVLQMTPDTVAKIPDTLLYELLVKRGLKVGPIVATTRNFYEKMLNEEIRKGIAETQNGEQTNGSTANEHVGNGNGYSTDEEPVAAITPPRKSKSKSVTPKRITSANADTSVGSETVEAGLSIKPKSALQTILEPSKTNATPAPMCTTPVKRPGARARTEALFLSSNTPKVTSSATTSRTKTYSRVFASSSTNDEVVSHPLVPKLNKKQVLAKEIDCGDKKHGFTFYFIMALILVFLAVGFFYLAGRKTELTPDELIDKDIDDVLMKLKDSQKQ